jgi:calcineurin-like phosphoesterase family protein
MLYTISDTHFQNSNIIKYSNRPFANSDDQTRQLIERWNSVVTHDDTVIVCGDFIMGAADGVVDILYQLNGSIILVRGNHDTNKKIEIYGEHPHRVTVKDIHYEQFGGLWFVFCHFPIVHPEFAKMVFQDNSEVVWVHGHVHDKCEHFNAETHSFNVSCEVIDYTPVPVRILFHTVKQAFMEKGVWKGN